MADQYPKATGKDDQLAQKQAVKHEQDQLKTAPRSGSALKNDSYHRAASWGIQGKHPDARVFQQKDARGNPIAVTQVPGKLEVKPGEKHSGIYETVRNKEINKVTHQTFDSTKQVPDGKTQGQRREILQGHNTPTQQKLQAVKQTPANNTQSSQLSPTQNKLASAKATSTPTSKPSNSNPSPSPKIQ
jgi:hypothetical protein